PGADGAGTGRGTGTGAGLGCGAGWTVRAGGAGGGAKTRTIRGARNAGGTPADSTAVPLLSMVAATRQRTRPT
ncbi:MAG TPA: hypothetical protein DER64_11375, partial [Planctomycetaceae bacterium]|nr:hypothetical protein [Planctomycetaceae bacterium]